MNIWAPEPCTTDTETVAEAKVNETIRVIIGSAIAESRLRLRLRLRHSRLRLTQNVIISLYPGYSVS